MTEKRPYRLLLALFDPTLLPYWLNLAANLIPDDGEIKLRGMVLVPDDTSLSEGTLAARAWRDAFSQVSDDYPLVSAPLVTVDYQPMRRLLHEMADDYYDLLMVEWGGAQQLTGGVDTDEILQDAPCDLVLATSNLHQEDGPVLLSLRGGPNLSLGLRVAKALAEESSISLFHAADRPRAAPDLEVIMRAEPNIKRSVTAISSITEGILREANGHKAIVLGATFHQPDPNTSTSGAIVSRLQDHTDKPLVMVRAWQPETLGFHAPRLLTRIEEDLSTRVDRWFAENTFHSHEFSDLRQLLSLKEKQGVTISLGLPALNEEETVGEVIKTLKTALMDEVPLLDEIVLIDSNSTDRTVEIAQSLGIPTYIHQEILPETGANIGKGEALWKSLYALKGDIIAWVDTDISNIHPRFVYGLIGPMLYRPQIQYVKGFYQRPIKIGNQLQAGGGGRVTELVVRPLLNLFYPELSGLIQPLSGEYAGRRSALEQVPFFSGYGVETGLLIDLLNRFGLETIAQTDLEMRVHHNQPLVGLSKMSFAILQVFISRLESRYGTQLLDKVHHSMKVIVQEPDRFALDIHQIEDIERPAMLSIQAYQERSGSLTTWN